LAFKFSLYRYSAAVKRPAREMRYDVAAGVEPAAISTDRGGALQVESI
jgi:hypothetical protein